MRFYMRVPRRVIARAYARRPLSSKLTRFRITVASYGWEPDYDVMPEINVSESLYQTLEEATDGEDVEEALWEMVYLRQRGNDPV